MHDAQKWTMDLTKKDRKRLKFKKILNLIFTWYLVLIMLAMFAFGYNLVAIEGDEIGWLLIGSAFVIIFIPFITFRTYKRLKADIAGGVKEAVKGKIEGTYRHKNSCEFTIAGEKYQVNWKAYIKFSKGDEVLISYAPTAKIMLDIEGIESQE